MQTNWKHVNLWLTNDISTNILKDKELNGYVWIIADIVTWMEKTISKWIEKNKEFKTKEK